MGVSLPFQGRRGEFVCHNKACYTEIWQKQGRELRISLWSVKSAVGMTAIWFPLPMVPADAETVKIIVPVCQTQVDELTRISEEIETGEGFAGSILKTL